MLKKRILKTCLTLALAVGSILPSAIISDVPKVKAGSVTMPYVSGSVMTIDVTHDYTTSTSSCYYHDDIGIIDLVANTVLESRSVSKYNGSVSSGTPFTTTLSFSRDNFVVGRKYAIKYISDNTGPSTCPSSYKSPSDAASYSKLISYFVGGDPGNGTLTNPSTNGDNNDNGDQSTPTLDPKWNSLKFSSGNNWNSLPVSLRNEDVWTYISPKSYPVYAGRNSTATLDGKIYVVGARTTSSSPSIETWTFNPSTDLWTRLADVPEASNSYLNVVAYNGKLYVYNSYNQNMNVYTPSTNTWATLGLSGTVPMLSATAITVSSNGTMYMFSGYNYNVSNESNGLYSLNLNTGVWTTIEDTASVGGPSAREYSSMTIGADGQLYVFGGSSASNSDTPLTLHKFDLSTRIWSSVAVTGSIYARTYLSLQPVGQYIYIIGGITSYNNADDPVPTIWKYDTVSNTFSQAKYGPILMLGGMAEATVVNNDIYILDRDSSGRVTFYKFNTVRNVLLRYDHFAETATPTGDDGAMAVDNDAMYVFSGGSFFTHSLSTGTWVKSVWSPLEEDPSRMGQLVSSNGGIYYFGGGEYINQSYDFLSNATLMYNPVSKTWTDLRTISSATPELYYWEGMAVAEYDNKIYLHGGYYSTNSYYNSTLYELDTASNTWNTYTVLSARDHHVMARVNNKIFIYGGRNSSGALLSSVASLDLTTGTATSSVFTTTSTCFGATAQVYSGIIYVFGGDVDSITSGNYGSSNILALNVTNNTYYQTSYGPFVFPGSMSHMSSSKYNDRVYLFGGRSASSSLYGSNIMKFDPTTETLTYKRLPTANVPPNTQNQQYVLLGGIIYTFTDRGFYQLNLTTMEWYSLPWSPSVGNFQNYAMTVANDKIYIFGGTQNGVSTIADNGMLEYDPALDKWAYYKRSAGTGLSNRFGSSMNLVGNALYIFGGMNGTTSYNDIKKFDLPTKTWVAITASGSTPTARSNHAAFVVNDIIYVFGGAGYSSGEIVVDSMYSFNPFTSAWVNIIPSGATISARKGAYPIVWNNIAYIFGGTTASGASYYTDVYSFDAVANSFTAVPVSGGPTGRASGSFVLYDNQFILVGGAIASNGAAGDAWGLSIVQDNTIVPKINSFTINGGITSLASTNVTVSISADGQGNPLKYIVLSNDNFNTFQAFEYGTSVLSTNIAWTVPPGAGTKTIYIAVFSAYGVMSQPRSTSGYIAGQDTEAPIITSWQVGSGGTSTKNATETILIDGVKENVTVTSNLRYRLSQDGGQAFYSYNGVSWTGGWSTDFRTSLPNFPLTLGQNALVLQIKDEAGNIGSSMFIITRVDNATTPSTDSTVNNPTPTVTGVGTNLNGQIVSLSDGVVAQVSQRSTPVLSFTNLQNASKIYYSLDGMTFSQPFAIPSATTSYNLSIPFKQNGLQPVFFYLENDLGAISDTMSRMFLVDTEAPKIADVEAQNFTSSSASARVSIEASDNVTTKLYYQYNTGSGASSWALIPSDGVITVPITSTVNNIVLSVTDEAGNVASKTIAKPTVNDTEAPVFNSLKTLNGASATRVNTIDLTIDAKDNISTTLQYSTNRGSTWATLPADGIITYTVGSTPGMVPVVVQLKDGAGNIATKVINIWRL